ncbi:hypothetical protein TRIUR3_07692 [Triticum urartu]|uniref:At1g61320/AtMIF1 LRR domain-containing protein n=1 Tax=Triticum urartu TaxID=4572 RepID=M7Z1U9_TRIUA|nr:hypothetical protein TRIUR3_07692 [Triticum urartu]
MNIYQLFEITTVKDGSAASSLAIGNGSVCQQEDNSRDGTGGEYSGPELPEDIWCHIHSLMTLRDAARAACLSRTFLRSWRCHPNLILDHGILFQLRHVLASTVNHIFENHSGIGVKTLKLDFSCYHEPKAYSYLHRWLRIAVTPGTEKLVVLSASDVAFNFPCSILSDGNGITIQHLHLVDCGFHPTVSLVCMRSLTVLHFDRVAVTGDELGYLFSSCVALEQLKLRRCSKITCLEIPFELQRLSYLQVSVCHKLRMIKNEAPNICSFDFLGDRIEISLGDSLRLKNLDVLCNNVLRYACEEFPSSAPNLETLSIFSRHEVANTAMAFTPSKFLHLKYLSISIAVAYDYLSLVYFLDAAPSLETFKLCVLTGLRPADELLLEDPSQLRQMSGYCHHKLQTVKISRFCSSKSMVELVSHILENSVSLECLTLDTTDCSFRCSGDRSTRCSDLVRPWEADKAVLVIKKYIKGKVPSTVKLDVVEPCNRCHVILLDGGGWIRA